MQPRGNTVLQDAEGLLRERRLDEARSLLTDYLQKNPSSARGWWLLSFAITDVGQQIECLERVLQIDPQNAATQARLGKLKAAGVSPFLPETDSNSLLARSAPRSSIVKRRPNWVLPVSILSVFLCLTVGVAGFALVLKNRQPAAEQPTQSPLLPGQSTPTLLGLPPTWTPTITLTPAPTHTRLPELDVNLTATEIPNSTMGIATGMDAPDFTLRDVSTGEQVTLSSYNGQPVIIFFFTSWSAYSQGQAPALLQIHEEFQNKNVMILAVSVGEDADSARAFRESNGLSFPVLRDPDAEIFFQYKGTHVPLNYFVDSNGKVSTFKRGMMDYSMLNIQVRVLLGLIPTVSP